MSGVLMWQCLGAWWYMIFILCCCREVIGGGFKSVELKSGVVCDFLEEIPANSYMCYHAVVHSDSVIGYRQEETEVLSIVRPCPTCFPEVQTVTVTSEVPIYGNACRVTPLYRKPRVIKSTTDGVKILTTPGYTNGNGYSPHLLCVWNIECEDGESIYFNVTQQDTEGDMEEEESGDNCLDYVQVIARNFSQISCGDQAHRLLQNQVNCEEMRVIFRSNERKTGQGIRMDVTCFNHSSDNRLQDSVTGASSSEECAGGRGNETKSTPNKEEEAIIHVAFDTHYKLMLATDMCSKGVERCARVDFASLADDIQQAKNILGQYSDSCNPVVKNMIQKTLDLLQ